MPYIPWYVAGIVMLALTNWIAVTIPVVVAQAVDALRAGDAGGGVKQAAVRIGLLGLAVIATRTLSRVAFFKPGRLVEARIKKHLFSQLMRQQPAFHASWPAGDLVSRASSDLNFVLLLSGFGALQICYATMAISLVVSLSMVLMMANTLGTGTQTIQGSRLTNEMRTAMQLMTRDLRRANYHQNAMDCMSNPNCSPDPSLIVAVIPVSER